MEINISYDLTFVLDYKQKFNRILANAFDPFNFLLFGHLEFFWEQNHSFAIQKNPSHVGKHAARI